MRNFYYSIKIKADVVVDAEPMIRLLAMNPKAANAAAAMKMHTYAVVLLK